MLSNVICVADMGAKPAKKRGGFPFQIAMAVCVTDVYVQYHQTMWLFIAPMNVHLQMHKSTPVTGNADGFFISSLPSQT